MDGLNVPFPTNPAGEDEFVDAVQGPVAQAQGPTAQGPANNNAPVGPNVPVQPPHQPAQPVPTGLVVPASQVVYQNWVG